MNTWKKLMEKDARMERRMERHERKAENGDMENKSHMENKSRDRLDSDDVDGFLECQPQVHLDKEDRQRIINSVKLTKALVLLGYSCWSELEPGKKMVLITFVSPNNYIIERIITYRISSIT